MSHYPYASPITPLANETGQLNSHVSNTCLMPKLAKLDIEAKLA